MNYLMNEREITIIQQNKLVAQKMSQIDICNYKTSFFVNLLEKDMHCAKFVRIRSSCGPYFLAFGLNTDIYRVILCIQPKCGKIRTRKTPNKDIFQTVSLSQLAKEIQILGYDMSKICKMYPVHFQ